MQTTDQNSTETSISASLILFHDGQFWVGVAERVEDGRLSACRIVFGAEPSDEEIFQFVCRKWSSLPFQGNLEAEPPKTSKNPKRRMREAAKAVSQRGASTKSQQALSEAREAMKEESKAKRTEAKRELERERFEQKQAKKKLKKRGH
ncbi:MAG: YjdF family protein [Anaerotardibacter sp.]